MISWPLVLVLLSAADAITTPAGGSSAPAPASAPAGKQMKIFTNQFVIEVQGGETEARRLAEKHGFIYLNHILGDFYHLEHRRLARRSLAAADMRQLDTSIEEEPQVLKFERQVLKKRVKRDFIDLDRPPTGLSGGGGRAQQQQQLQAQLQLQLAASQRSGQLLRPANAARPAQFVRPANQPPGSLASHQRQQPPPPPAGQLQASSAAAAAAAARLTAAQRQQYFDLLEMTSSGPPPFFLHANHSAASAVAPQGHANTQKAHRPPPPPPQLGEAARAAGLQAQRPHANDTVRPAPFNDPSWPLMWYLDGGARNGFDLNVQAAWRMGYTGKGIVITILDDGLEKDHPDLQANYDPLASFDINNDDADPMPRYDANDSNRHGTRCAGEVAAVPDNNICSIGIAYNSKVGGVRMLDGDVTDAVEARSLGLNNQHIHIYSASWGPDDNGKTVDGPGELATRAFIEGVTNGRQGLGSIFVFASGNGGREHDNCNCDGYTNSIWTLSISSATENGLVPWYIEACSSTLATTYSSGSYDERQIATTDIRHSCTNNHTGTSASAPIAAGICALVLESNPRLTWRDMQHIVVRTAKPANLVAKDWRTNALGRNVSHAFGYGLMDAAAMINTARRWTTVPMQYTCQVSSPQMEKFIPAKGHIELKLRAECANVRFLEHVQSKVTLTASRRGDLHIYLTSPSGTRSTLLAQRPNDQAEQGFRNWPFMTVHNWGESPNGVWTLEVHNDGKPQNRAFFKEWTLMLYGTYDDPNKHLDQAAGQQAPARVAPAPSRVAAPSSEPATAAAASSSPPPPPPPPSFAPASTDSTTMAAPSTSTTMSSGHENQQLQPKRLPALEQHQHHSPPAPISEGGASLASVTSVAPALPPKKLANVSTLALPPPPPPPPPPPATQATTTTTGTSADIATTVATTQATQPIGLEGAQAGKEEAVGAKTDFDVVSAPAVAGGRPGEQPRPADNSSEPAGANLKPPVGALDERPPNGKQQNELDANLLDSRLSKDYRSSGGGQDSLQLLVNERRQQRPGEQTSGAGGNSPDNSRQAEGSAARGAAAAANQLLLHASLLLQLGAAIALTRRELRPAARAAS